MFGIQQTRILLFHDYENPSCIAVRSVYNELFITVCCKDHLFYAKQFQKTFTNIIVVRVEERLPPSFKNFGKIINFIAKKKNYFAQTKFFIPRNRTSPAGEKFFLDITIFCD